MPLIELGNRTDIDIRIARLLTLMSLLNGRVFDHGSCTHRTLMTIEQPPKPELPRDPDVINKPGGAESPEPDHNNPEKPEVQPTPPPTDPEPPAI